MLSYLLATSLLIAKAPSEYVSGIGWVNSKIVSHCLVTVGVPETDHLHDHTWEQFQDCVTTLRSRRR